MKQQTRTMAFATMPTGKSTLIEELDESVSGTP
jgi:hypothetical protein